MRQLPPLLERERSRLLGYLLANGLAQAGLAVILALTVRGLIDVSVTEPSGDGQIALSVSSMIACTLFLSLLKWRERVDAEALGQNYIVALRLIVFDHLHNMSYRALSGRRQGLLISRFVSDLGSLKQWISVGVARAVVGAVSMLGCLAALIILQPWIGGAVAVTAGGGVLSLLLAGRRLDLSIRDVRRRRGQLAANVSEKLGSMATIQAFAKHRAERRKLKRQSNKLAQAMATNASMTGILRAGAQGLVGMTTAAAVVSGAWCASRGVATVGDVVASMGIVSMLSPSFFLCARLFQLHSAAVVATERTLSLLRLGPLVVSPLHPRAMPRGGELRFHRVCVDGSLTAFSRTAGAGQRIAIRGANGRGKSTLLQLAVRLIDPDAGVVSFDRVPLVALSVVERRRTISLVSADLPLLRGTVQRNLTFGLRSASPRRIARVAKLCQLDLHSEHSPFYAQRKLHERGGNLSQGQRMRLLLARALILQPAVLLIDEADAGLDQAGIRLLKRIICDYPGTVLFVSHRRVLLNCAEETWDLTGRQTVPQAASSEPRRQSSRRTAAGRLVPVTSTSQASTRQAV